MIVTRLLVGVAVVAMLALPGCTSQKSDLTFLSAGKLARAAISPPKLKLDPVKLSRTAQKALASTGPDEPLATVQLPSVKGQSVLRVIETNGPYSTWAAWGSTDRRTITTKNGIITATRAIPPDLMSADVDGVLALVSRREEGTVLYTQRYLDGNHQEIEAKTSCVVSRGFEKFVEYGQVRQPALQMFSSCVAQNRQFVDLFLVSNSGRILQSRQWVGPTLGFATFQLLR
ncbi:YjbF family lipoprotein [Roseovarius sp.]|uniref:YjbF family lipoprotein n=1 Tax=Roseovarius sp. TaxID=1486281 RepID=UPI003BA92A9B